MPDLTGMPALDLAIGLSFVFLMLSLLCSAIQEAISALLALRASELQKGLRAMLLQTGGDQASSGATGGAGSDFVDLLYGKPLIRGVQKKTWWPAGRKDGRRMPSYISPRAFSLTLLDTIAPPLPADAPANYDLIANAETRLAATNLPSEVQETLTGMLKRADQDLDAFRAGVEEWFDDTMARVSGWYKRKTQIILVVIAAVVTLGLNANTLTIGERLWNDDALRASVVAQAVKETEGSERAKVQDAKARLEAAAKDVDGLQTLSVPIGWTDKKDDHRYIDSAPEALLGWLLTIIGLSLGAPFWFDALSRLSRLRSTGKPEQPLPASAFGKPGERVKKAATTDQG